MYGSTYYGQTFIGNGYPIDTATATFNGVIVGYDEVTATFNGVIVGTAIVYTATLSSQGTVYTPTYAQQIF